MGSKPEIMSSGLASVRGEDNREVLRSVLQLLLTPRCIADG